MRFPGVFLSTKLCWHFEGDLKRKRPIAYFYSAIMLILAMDFVGVILQGEKCC
jgi:hypothetical protein